MIFAGLRLSPPQLQLLRDLLQQPQPLTDPQQLEELHVLQRYAEQRAKHLQHLQQLLQPGTTLKVELQQELDDLLPLLPQSTGKRQVARQSAQEPVSLPYSTVFLATVIFPCI